ncbi:MAG: response regulator [Ramlibacter sp.]|nr:hybrid sensor histidine kinase/response regulator [Ramlibacter sp.]
MTPPSDRAKPNILVVDDTAENLRLLTNLFREHGYEVRPVPSGKLALQAVAMDPPDLVLLDIQMPEMNGYEVCEELKQNEAWMDIPVIFVSALDEVFDKVRAFSVGGVDYISKPFQVEEVLARVRTHLALRRTQLDLTATIARMRELERLRESLVQMAVHDLKSPLWGIEHFMERLAGETAGRIRPEAETQLKRVQVAASDLARMVHGMLDLSRLESRRMPVSPEVVDAAALVRQAIENVVAGDKSRAITVEVPSGISVWADPDAMRRVLENLVSNGLKHTPDGTPLGVRAAASEAGVRMEVTDKGDGVPEEDRDRIFDKFGALQARSRYHSSGLGLAFCRLAVEAHGGRIGVTEAPGGGSTFWLELPPRPPA